MDPEEATPLLAVIDSGTTVMLLPSKVFEGFINQLAAKFKDDHSVNMICTKSSDAPGEIELCFFNSTTCKQMYSKLEPIKFVFDKAVFELSSEAYLKDDLNVIEETGQKVPACMIDLRSGKDKVTGSSRFLMGNSFLKNFYSVYDYDW